MPLSRGARMLAEARDLLRGGLRFGDEAQIEAHRFWEKVEVAKSLLRSGVSPMELYWCGDWEVADAAVADLQNPGGGKHASQ